MSKVIYDKSTPEYDATDRSGIEILAENSSNRAVLTFVGLGADFSGGTATIHVKSHNSRRYLALKNGAGSAVTVNLATTDSVVIDQPVAAVRVGVSGIAGATGWKAVLSGIDEPMSADSLNPGSSVQIVAGQSAVGTAPANPPVGVAGVDGEGKKRALLTDATGQLTTITPDCADVSGSVSSAAVLFTVDMLNYQSICVNVTSAGGGNVIAWEASADGLTNWIPVSGAVIAPSAAVVDVVSSLSSVNSVIIGKRLRYFRARVSIYGSGTVTVVGNLLDTAVTTLVVALCAGASGEGSSVAGFPVAIAAEARTSSKPSRGNGQVVRPIATVEGRLVMRPHSIPENEWSYAAASGGISNTTTAVTIKTASGAGVRNYVTSIQVMSEALTNATELTIENGDGTVLWRTKITTAGLPTDPIRFDDPIRSTANQSLQVRTVTASGTGAIYFNAQGYIAP